VKTESKMLFEPPKQALKSWENFPKISSLCLPYVYIYAYKTCIFLTSTGSSGIVSSCSITIFANIYGLYTKHLTGYRFEPHCWQK